MKTSVIYDNVMQGIKEGNRRIILQGGQYSGKTVDTLGALATLASEDEPGVTTVTSMSMPHLKGGALRDFETYVYPSFKKSIKKYHKTDHIFSFRSGHLIEFKVFEDEETARGPKRKRLFVNEANKFLWMVFFHLDGRSDQTIIDYNPSIRFWSHEKLIGQPGNKLYISDHRSNPFLADTKHQEIESFAIFKRDEEGNVLFHKGEPIVTKGNYELWKVYARGLTGNITGIIFPHWQMIDENDFPKDLVDWVYSIDFGYTNDPTAIVKICKVGNTIFIKELAYEAGLAPIAIKQILEGNGYECGRDPLYCEHDPDMVRILRNLGVSAFMARKGPGSVNAGIELINSFDVKFSNKSTNIERERSVYIWDTDEETGKSTNTPVDKNNHLMDACRYGIYTKFLRSEI